MKYKIEITAFIFSTIATLIFQRFIITPSKFLVSTLIGMLFFLIYRYLFIDEKEIQVTLPYKTYIFFSLVIISAICLLLVSPINELMFLPWTSIPSHNILRLISAFLLIFLAPSYIIVSIVDREDKLSFLEKLLFSIIINNLLLPFFGCISFALGSNIANSGLHFIIALNIFLSLLYILLGRRKAGKPLLIKLNEHLILCFYLALAGALVLDKYFSNITWDYGDLDLYYGYAVSFTKSVFPLDVIGPGMVYPYFPFIFAAEFFILSGIPYINAFQFINIVMSLLPILSFYIMVSAFSFRNRKIPIIATMFGFFGGGLGWVFGLNYLRNVTVQNLYKLFKLMAKADSGYLVPPFYPAGMYPLYTHALTCIFALMWLIYSDKGDKLGGTRYLLVAVTIAVGYLAHIAEIIFFIVFFLLSIIFFKNYSAYRRICASTLAGLLIVALPDIISGGSFYIAGDPLTYYGLTLYSAIVLLVVTFLLFSIVFYYNNYIKRVHNIIISKLGKRGLFLCKSIFSTFIIYIYILSLIHI